jgi:hypothetical protein
MLILLKHIDVHLKKTRPCVFPFPIAPLYSDKDVFLEKKQIFYYLPSEWTTMINYINNSTSIWTKINYVNKIEVIISRQLNIGRVWMVNVSVIVSF